MKKTGEILKKAREEKGLSLHEIGLSLKISSKVLKAIEEGDEAHLPAKTFLRGFVQSYANFLHLDSEKVLEVFYEEMGSTRPKPYIRPVDEKPIEDSVTQTTASSSTSEPAVASVTPIRKATPPPSKSADGMQSLRENKTTKTVIVIVIGVVLVGLILFTKKMIDKYSKEAEVPSNEVAQTMEGATPVTEGPLVDTEPPTESAPMIALPTVTPSPAMTSGGTSHDKPAAHATPVTSPSPVAKETPKPSPSPSPTHSPSPTPVASATPSPSATPVASATPTPTPTPKPTPKEEGSKPVELIVEALDTVEIEYAAPNGKPQKIKLSAEQVHTFKSKSGLKINFSNGGAVNLIMNGKELGIPGDLGKPIKLSY